MAEVEANGAAAATADAEPAAAAPPAPVEKLKRLPKPDEAEYVAKFDKLNSQINAMNARLGEIKDSLDAFHDKRKSGSGEQVELRNKLNDEKSRFQAILAKKGEIKAQLERINKHRDELRGQAKSTKDKTQYMSEKDIDDKVKKLQHKLEHTSLTLNEEKQVIQQLKDLEKSRTLVSQYADQMDKMSNSNELRESVIMELKARDDELQQIKDRQKGLQDELGALREKENADLPNVPQLMLERKECYEVIKAAKQAKNTLYAERKAALDEYYQREREVKSQIQAERKSKWEQRQKEYEARQKERKEREEAEKGEPFEDEIIMCDQMVIYLTGMLPKEAVAEPEVGSSGATEPTAPEAGMKLVKKKGSGDNEMEAMFAGLGGKKGGKKNKKSTKKEEPVAARIQHSIDTLSAFSKLKIDVPLKSTDVATALEGIKAAKEGFLLKRVAEKERRATASEAGASGAAEAEAGEEEAAVDEAADLAELADVLLTLTVVDDAVELSLKVKEDVVQES